MKPVTVTVDFMRGGVEKLGDTFAAATIERLGEQPAGGDGSSPARRAR